MQKPHLHKPEVADIGGLHWWSSPRQLLRYVLSLDDSPHQIALGAAIGMFIGLTPTVGVQMAITLAVYYLCLPFFRFNCKAAIVMVYISNPLTMVPLYWFDYRVGQALFGGGDVSRSQFAAILNYHGWAEWWPTIRTLFVDLGWTMIAGSLIVGAVGAAVTYPAMRALLTRFRRTQQPQASPERPVPVAAGDRENG